MESVGFADGETALCASVLRPTGTPRGVVLVCPTIANRNAAMDRRAAMLAEAGYVAIVGDYYGTTGGPIEQAFAMGQALMADGDRFRARIAANCELAHQLAEDRPLLAIGFCMGGRAVLELARTNAPIRAAISFHGLLQTDRPATRAIKPAILVCHGDADPMVPRSHVSDFEAEMDAAQADWQLMVFGNARHGFTDPDSDLRDNDAVAYHAQADRQSWSAAMLLADAVTA